MGELIGTITATSQDVRNQALDTICARLTLEKLLEECKELDAFRRRSDNLYERVRALFFLYAIHRFHLPARFQAQTQRQESPQSRIPFKGYEHLLRRRFEEAIDHFLEAGIAQGPNDALSSALAAAYYELGFQTLADQVRRSVRLVRGNQWMFRMGHPADHPLRIQPALLKLNHTDGTYPVLRELAPVRMDLTHCGWSDIFFLGMDFPEGAKVLNVSIDLSIHGQGKVPHPPVEAYLRVIEEPLLRLVSVDLRTATDVSHLAEVFDFGKDYLGLLKAAVIAAGIVPAGIEGSGQSLAELLSRLVGPGFGLEIVSNVNNIPKGSRLAVSTTLLAALVTVCMRATGQTSSLAGTLQEQERRLVLARALLGEWLGGSGGGWQDSGGVWPGMKLIEGVPAAPGDPEFGISRGCLMPQHRILNFKDASAETREKLQHSLVLVHGGLAQNVGPILEMVTEKYLLRSEMEWTARQNMQGILGDILSGLQRGELRQIASATTRNFKGPIQDIIPWATNHFTELLIDQVKKEFGDGFWGFLMLGGMAGGGMGFFFDPKIKPEAQNRLQEIMSALKAELQAALPFAMEPVVYDFNINERGVTAELLEGAGALMPANYYALVVPSLLRQHPGTLSALRRSELDKFGAACRGRPELRGMVQTFFDVMLPRGKSESLPGDSLEVLLQSNGFDRLQHEQIRAALKEGRIGMAQNQLPASTVIEDVQAVSLMDLLLANKLVRPPDIPQAKAAHYGAEVVNLGEVKISDDVITMVPRHIARQYRVIPVFKHEGSLTVAIADPSDLDAIDSLNHLLGMEINLQVASEEDIENALSNYYGESGNIRAVASKSAEMVWAPTGHRSEKVIHFGPGTSERLLNLGNQSIERGEVAVVTLAAGAGSRWTEGAGVVKALHPFCKFKGRHRTFIETHLAKSRKISRSSGSPVPHIFTTGYLTHEPISQFLAAQKQYGYEGPLLLSPGRAVGLRLIPTLRDLRFVWEEMPQQALDEQQQKMLQSRRQALMNWAKQTGEAADYTDNLPLQCLHPVGHWFEVPNLFRNGVLAKLLEHRPQLRYLLMHNIDTVGANLDPALLGLHIQSKACLTFEVITRRLEDRGGGLACVNGRVRLIEGLAMPREDAEFGLSYYNSNTCWINLDRVLESFSLTREDIAQSSEDEKQEKIADAIRAMATRLPTYITIKDVKKRWGHGQEDVFPVAQFEKLWVDMTGLPEIDSRFVVVPRLRGHQLKEQGQLDGWLRDGSAAYVDTLCEWD